MGAEERSSDSEVVMTPTVRPQSSTAAVSYSSDNTLRSLNCDGVLLDSSMVFFYTMTSQCWSKMTNVSSESDKINEISFFDCCL